MRLYDTIYNKVKSLVINGFPGGKAELPDDLKPFWSVRNDLVFDDELIMYGCRLFIPSALRYQVLFNLHESHQGVTRTKERARLAVYWLEIDRDTETIIMASKEGQDELPSLATELMISHTLPDRPFQHLALDFAQFNGGDYLIMIDCYTDWPSIQAMRQNTTVRFLIIALREYFYNISICSK